MRRLLLLVVMVVSIVAAETAQAVVVDLGAAGKFGLAYDARTPAPAGATCSDPFLSSDLRLQGNGLCWHGGAVMHNNETFTLTWDPVRSYFQTTRDYVQQFLRDVADGSGTLTSPYSVTTQYRDGSAAVNRAGNASLFGGGCIDYGLPGGSACRFGNTDGSAPGHDFGPNACTVTGINQFAEAADGTFGDGSNTVCVTDNQVKSELHTSITQTGLLGKTKPGYTPLIVVLTPPGVVTCLDETGTSCSANGTSATPFCSYHSQVDVGGRMVAYLVQPWTASWHHDIGCDEPDVPSWQDLPTADELARGVGIRLVSPLSQAHLAAIVNPGLDGWYGANGAEINDNGCYRLDHQRDRVSVGRSAQNPYFLQREFSNAGVIQTDPNGPACTPYVLLGPTFVAPSAVNAGDLVQFDGSTTVSSLIVPDDSYSWDFGDGSLATGPSVSHTYEHGGTFTVKLIVIDRGGNTGSYSQTVTVLGPTGRPVAPPPSRTPNPGIHARLQLMPQGLRAVLRSGLSLEVTANEAADGIATLSISRRAARQAHLKTGRDGTVVVGHGTVSGIKRGTVKLHIRLPRTTATKLAKLRHLMVTVRLALVAASRDRLAIVAAGRY